MDASNLFWFSLGLVLLMTGGELLVRGASRLAAAIGISPLIVGLTVVAFGTSSPEAAVSIQSAFAGQADVAVGNVVGSNLLNILLILGLSALVGPLLISQQLIRLDVPIMVGVSLLFWLLALDGTLGRVEGSLLFAGVVAYTFFAVKKSRKESAEVKEEYAAHYRRARAFGLAANFLLVVVGIASLALGARWLVDSAAAMARALGVSELIVGLTLVALGTSLPEVATSVIATIRGERDIAVGNVIGSNIFNILAVAGLTAIMSPTGLAVSGPALRFDIPVMIAAAVACLPIFFSGSVIDRWEGALFIAYYAAYTFYVTVAANQHDALQLFSSMMLIFVLPPTILTLVIVVIREARLRRRQGA
jgi:cation:H+ antiporter